MKTAPPMNIFDFFHTHQLRKSGKFKIGPFWPKMNFPNQNVFMLGINLTKMTS